MIIDDLFETRKDFVKNMVQCISEIETPSTFCIDAGWGYGKTTFLDVLSEELLKNNFCVLRYNSWENDYEQDPFSSLFLEIIPQISRYLSKQEIAVKIAVDLTCSLIAGGLAVTKNITSKTLPFLPDLTETGKDYAEYLVKVKKTIKGKASRIPKQSTQQKDLESFKANLLTLSDKLHELNTQFKKIVVLIDELDRCKPSFAIELLERVKHLLNQEGFVFVFALNKQALESTVINMYGDVDPDGYLRRFFDYELLLPEPDLLEFSSHLIKEDNFPEIKKTSLSIFPEMVAHASCSLRDVEKMFKKLKLTLHIIPNKSFDECMNFFLPFCIITMNQDIDWNRDFFSDATTFENHQRTYQKSSCLMSIQNDIFSILKRKNKKIKFQGGLLSLFVESKSDDGADTSHLVDFYFKDTRIFSFKTPTNITNRGIGNEFESYPMKLNPQDYKRYRDVLMYLYQLVNSLTSSTNF